MGYNISLTSSASQNEGNTTGASFSFTLTRQAGDEVETNYSYTIYQIGADGLPSGVATDFTTSTSPFVWPAGPGSFTVTITANPDTTIEPNENFQVFFYRVPAGSPIFISNSTTLTLVNDDVGPPVFNTSSALTAAENGTAVATISASGGGAVTYSLAGGAGADQGLFAIDANTGALTFLAPKNFEAPGDAGGNNVYDVEVIATAGGVATTQAFAVTLTNVNEAITNTTGAAFGVNENTTAITTATATDIDVGDTVTWSIAGGADASAFRIDASTGALSFATGRNFEAPTDSGANNTYVVDLRATDSGGLSSTQTVTVTVGNVAEAPVISSNGGSTLAFVHVPENTANTTAVATLAATDDEGNAITYSVAGPDAAAFAINAATGVLTFANSPNYEAPTAVGGGNLYQIDLTATAVDGADVQTMYVFVDNVIEPGVPTDVPGAGGGGGGGGGGVGVGGTAGPDNIVGTVGPDVRTGGGGDDTMTGQEGDDWLDGDDGNDIILGGPGSDFIRGLNDNDIVSGGDGADTVNGNMGDDQVDGGAGADTVYGGQGSDLVDGGDGDDGYVNGNIGDDTVHGGAGADSVYGGQNNDIVFGDDGDDQVTGDLGNDLLYGGAGADRFLFAAGGGQDWAIDFNAAEGDRILLRPGQAYTVGSYLGQVMIDLGNGDVIGLSGVPSASFSSSWIVVG